MRAGKRRLALHDAHARIGLALASELIVLMRPAELGGALGDAGRVNVGSAAGASGEGTEQDRER
jgi:hypothetical protein